MTQRRPIPPDPLPWVRFNPLTSCYETPDGTQSAVELVDTAQCLADVLHIADIRSRQRETATKGLY
jgi:hypothetical protein